MILASIEGTVVAVVVGLVMVLIRWLGERGTGSVDANTGKRDEPRRSSSSSKMESEEERMRRFLEALGIPADSAETQRRPVPPPIRPQPMQRRETSVKPVPPIVADKPFSQPQPPKRVLQPKRPIQSPVKRAEAPSLDQAPAPVKPVAQIQVPELWTPEVEDFQTISSKISAIPHLGADMGRSNLSIGSESREAGIGKPELWREALRSPEALRSAFIIKEILGPPRGLQNDPAAPSFPSL